MSRRWWLAALPLLAWAPVRVSAQEGSGQPQPTVRQPEKESWEVSVGTDVSHVWGDLESSSDLDMVIVDSMFKLEGPAWRGAKLAFELGHEFRHYDFGGSQPFYPILNEPWQDVNTASAGVRLIQGFTEDWAIIAGAAGKASADADADLFDGVSGLFYLGVGHDFGHGFKAGAGVMMLARFEDDVEFLPWVQFRWDINECWRASLEGTRFELRWMPGKEWFVKGGLGFDAIRFRLEDGVIVDNDIVEDRRFYGFLGLGWRPCDWIEVDAEVGLDLWREIVIWDENGNNSRDFDMDIEPFVGVGVTLRF